MFLDFLWKKKAKKEVVIDENYIEVLRLRRDYNKIIKVVTNELLKGNDATFLYFALSEAYERVTRKPNLDVLIKLYTDFIEKNPNAVSILKLRAKFYFWANQLEYAENDLVNVLSLHPKDVLCHIELGNIRMDLHKINEAMESYDKALQLKPDAAQAFLGRANADLEKGNLDDAISDMSYAMGLIAPTPEMYMKRGDLNYEVGKYADAIKDYTSAIRAVPGNISYLSKRALTYTAQKNYNRAIADYEEILHIDKKNVNAMLESAQILHKYMKNSNAAMSILERAVKAKPTNPDIYKIRAYIKGDINDLTGSMMDFNTAIKYCDKDINRIIEIYTMRSELYYKQGFYEEAINDYNVLIEKWPNVPDLYKKRANALKEIQNYSAAVRDYSTIIKLVPDEVQNYITLAIIYIEHMKNNVSGLRIIDKAIAKFNKTSADLYQLKGEVMLKTKKYDEAIENFTTALEINPDSIEARYFRANAELTSKKINEAISDYTKILEQDDKYYKAYNKRAFCYTLTKQYTKAIEDYTNAINLNPDLSSAVFNRAKCKEITKDYEGALTDYTTAITLNPNNLDIYYQRGNLKQLLGDSAGALDDFSKTLKDDAE